jgi:hypothetical protein
MQLSAWRIFFLAFAGKIAGTLFAAICTAIGFGPDQWAEFLISGMPFLVTPGVVRLAFLLLASVTLASTFWSSIAGNNSLSKYVSIALSCLPFVVGSFYIIAEPQPDRHLSKAELNKLLVVFTPIADTFPNNIPVEAVSASPDAAGYALQFLRIFHQAGLTVNGLPPTDNDTTSLFPLTGQVASSQMRGLYIGIHAGVNVRLSEQAIRFQDALKQAGFIAPFIGWQGIGPNEFVFVVSYR